jgi:twitching motility protein PilU
MASRLVKDMLRQMMVSGASDLFITAGFPPSMKVTGDPHGLGNGADGRESPADVVRSMMNDKQTKEFDAHQGVQLRDRDEGLPRSRRRTSGRFRVSAFVQRGAWAWCAYDQHHIPSFEELGPAADIARNRDDQAWPGARGRWHRLRQVDDAGGDDRPPQRPHPRSHHHASRTRSSSCTSTRGCVVTQREVGVDTDSWHTGLKNTLRQAPDVILIGEIRDAETMEHAMQFAETGHLCLATLHANNANQALDRIVNFFPEERRGQLLMDLSLNVRALISQRLLLRETGKGRVAAMEVMLTSPLIADLISSR